MKKIFLKMIAGALLLILGSSVISCSREKTAEKVVLSTEQAKMLDDYKKNLEASQRIVVAKINGAVLTEKDLLDMMDLISPQFVKEAGKRSAETDKRTKKEALDTLIFRELAFQEATSMGMKAPAETVEETLKKLKADLGTESDYRNYLERSGLTEASLRKRIERDKLIEMVITREISDKVKVDEKLVRDTYMKEKKNFIEPETFLVEDVVLPAGKKDTAALDKAKMVLSLIQKNNNDISKIARDKTIIVRKGSIEAKEYPNIFKTAAKMKPGELSNVIKEEDGLHIIKLVRKEPLRQLSFQEARVDIERKLTQPDMNRVKERWKDSLKKKAKIEIKDSAGVASVP